MKWSSLKPAAVAAAFIAMGFVSPASADATLTVGDAHYLGLVNDGIPSNLANEVVYINTLLDQLAPSGPTLVGSETYTRSANDCGGPCSDAVLAGAVKQDNSNTTYDIDALGIQYILGKYDARQAGAYVWYVGDLTGVITLPATAGTCGASGCGLSHTSVFYSTDRPPQELPEPGTLAVAGLGLLGVALSRRRKQR